MSQEVIETWSAARWQRFLAEFWPAMEGWLNSSREAFTSELFFLLRKLSVARSVTERREINGRIWHLIQSVPGLRDAVHEAFEPSYPEIAENIVFSGPWAEIYDDDDRARRQQRNLRFAVDPGWQGIPYFEAGAAPFDGPGGSPAGVEGPWVPSGSLEEHPPVNRFLTVPVWYLTDRSPIGTSETLQRYGKRPTGHLRFGKAEVTIPDGSAHERGRLERPTKFLWVFELAEDPARHVTLRSVKEMAEADWMTQLRECVRRRGGGATAQDLLVFVHGYNMDFPSALMRAAQVARDVAFEGPTLAYAWSSKALPLAYTADEEAANDTSPRLEEALIHLLRHSGAKRVHIVAHSMGNRIIINALREVARKPLPKTASELREVVFAAPDVGTRNFTDFVSDYFRELHKAFNRKSNVPSRFTMYACGDDYALGLSRVVHDLTRAGDPRQELVVLPPLETIDVTRAIVSRDSHGYFASNRYVLADLFGVLRGEHPSRRNGLDLTAGNPAGSYWTMRA